MAKSKSNKADKKWFAVLGGFVVIALAIAYIIASGILGSWNPVAWIKKDTANTPRPEEPNAPTGAVVALDENGNELRSGKTYTMPKGLIFLSNNAGRSAAKGTLTPSADSVTVRANITPTNADDKRVTWESSDTDEVTVTPSEKYSLTATITLKVSAMHTQVTITCRSVDNPEVYATCTVDQLCNGENLALNAYIEGEPTSLIFGETYTVSAEFGLVSPGAGTMLGDTTNITWDILLTSEFCNVIRSYLAKSTNEVWNDYGCGATSATGCLRATPYESFDAEGLVNMDTFNNAFKLAAKEFKGTQAEFVISASYSFKGKVYKSDDVTIPVMFDVSNIWINVDNIDIDNDIIFGT